MIETEKGRLLRDIADATDKAEAFRAWEADADSMVVKPFGLPNGSSELVECVNGAFGEMFDDIRERAQAKLDGRVASLHAEFGVLVERAAPAYPESDVITITPLSKSRTASAKIVTLKPKKRTGRR